MRELTGAQINQNARWIDIHLKAISIYNRTLHRAHGQTPFKMFFKRNTGNLQQTVTNDNTEIELEDLTIVNRDNIEEKILPVPFNIPLEPNILENIESFVATSDLADETDFNIELRHQSYINDQQQHSTWLARSGPVYTRGIRVDLYRKFDNNLLTRRRLFDKETDGRVYEIVEVHDSGFIDIKEVGNDTQRNC